MLWFESLMRRLWENCLDEKEDKIVFGEEYNAFCGFNGLKIRTYEYIYLLFSRL